jgi:phage repressor protein C with HTH and peptisase S24 domain
LNHDQLPAGHLVKEITFFTKYGVKPQNVFAIYADGDSMADFIVDGDIVIFDKTKTEPRNGKIFVIEHPEGLRIKQLRRDIDGSWILESKNIDKRSFPDERINPDQMELLKLRGQFVYRQGG